MVTKNTEDSMKNLEPGTKLAEVGDKVRVAKDPMKIVGTVVSIFDNDQIDVCFPAMDKHDDRDDYHRTWSYRQHELEVVSPR